MPTPLQNQVESTAFVGVSHEAIRICAPTEVAARTAATLLRAKTKKPKSFKPGRGRPGQEEEQENPIITPSELNSEDLTEELIAQLRVRGLETPDMIEKKVVDRRAYLSKLKGKFVPIGPKPWDKPQFKKVCIEVPLDPKQASNTKIMNQVIEELRLISGKHPTVRKAGQNVATWNLRKGYPCGAGVHLTGQLMRDFLQRLNMVILPRVREFEGLKPTSFDKHANFQLGLDTQEPFRELDALIDDREITHGFYIGITNNCYTQPEALKLMKDYGFPFNDEIVKSKQLYKEKTFNVGKKR